jgi:MFS family permease
VEVVYAQHALHSGAGGYGALLSAWGGGAVAGSIVIARWRRRSPRTLITGSALALAAGFAVMAAAPSLAIALVGSVVAGVGNGVESTAAQTAVQQRAKQEWMALIMSLNQSVAQLAPGLGILLGGLIASLASARAALGVAGMGSLIFAAAVAFALRPAILAAPDPPRSPGGAASVGDASAPPPSGHTSVV